MLRQSPLINSKIGNSAPLLHQPEAARSAGHDQAIGQAIAQAVPGQPRSAKRYAKAQTHKVLFLQKSFCYFMQLFTLSP